MWWVAGIGGHWGLMGPVARVSFEQIPESRHTWHRKVLLCSWICLIFFFFFVSLSDHCFSFWLKCTRREEPVLQLGLSKQVRARQHISEVFSFPFYRRNLHWTQIIIFKKKKNSTQASAKSDNTKKEKKKKTGSPS